MYEYIKGSIIQRQPTHLVVETGGIGYLISISLHSFTQLDGVKEATILTHLIVKEDSHTLFGFTTEEERFLFIQLISVNGVGPNTARLILIRSAIINGDDLMFKKVKGVGPKTAQRIIIDLRDKMAKDLPSLDSKDNKSTAYHLKNEAISALIALGFGRPQIEQVFKNIPELSDPSTPIEDLIKIALKKLA